MAHHEFEAGEEIFHEGDESRDAYYIVSGRVQISIDTADGPRVLGKLEKGEIFGEMGMVADRPRSATATAIEATVAESFDEAVFEDYILKKPERVRIYLSTLFERLRTTDMLLQLEMRKRAEAGGEAQAEPSAGAVEPAAFLAPGARGGEGAGTQIPAAKPVPVETVNYRVTLRSLYNETGWDGEPIAVEIEKFPFRVGRAFDEEGVALFARNDLGIPDQMPFHVSRNHCEIDREGDKLFVRDRGSTLGTMVNETEIGMRTGRLTGALELGENDLIFGTEEGPHHFVVEVKNG